MITLCQIYSREKSKGKVKVNKMKKIFKSSFVMLLLVCTVVTFSSQVFASSPYISSLDIREGNSFYGSDYDCVAGNYAISIEPTSFKWYGYCNLTVDLYKNDFIGKTFLYGDTKYMDTEGKVYTYDMGDYDHNYSIKYYFEAKQGGVFADYGNVLIYGY